MEQQEREIAGKFDDRAYEVAKFIQQLSEIQDDYFKQLYGKAKEKGWLKYFEIDESGTDLAKDYLFDYCFNAKLNQSFSEYCDSMMKHWDGNRYN